MYNDKRESRSFSKSFMLYTPDDAYLLSGREGSRSIDPENASNYSFEKKPSRDKQFFTSFDKKTLTFDPKTKFKKALNATDPLKRVNSMYSAKSVYEELQMARRVKLPSVLQSIHHVLTEFDDSGEDLSMLPQVSKFLPHICNHKLVKIEPQLLYTQSHSLKSNYSIKSNHSNKSNNLIKSNNSITKSSHSSLTDLSSSPVPPNFTPLKSQLEKSDKPSATLEKPSATFEKPSATATRVDRVGRVYSGPLRIGLILSGGPAPGGHNVIAGVFDYLKHRNPESQLIGFMGGLDGLKYKRYQIITEDQMDQYRNLGGFNMLMSGRGMISTKQEFEMVLKTVTELELDGLIIVGGDGSNSNAANIANYLAQHYETLDKSKHSSEPVEKEKRCVVVGVPKTVDGDIRSYNIELTFGFDTAARTYSELIGNLCTDAASTQFNYHFVRIMGRSASHLALECALQTHPNMLLISEEVSQKNISLQQIVDDIVDLMQKRYEMGKTFGVILIPEGLVEFIPDFKVLVEELNNIVLHRTDSVDNVNSVENVEGEDRSVRMFDVGRLNRSKETWNFLPVNIQEQLLSDIESSGSILVAKIATESLLSMLVEARIHSRKLDHLLQIIIMTHYFGYEGRCAIPSEFDSSYCYSLGYTASVLVAQKKNGYMAAIRDLKNDIEDWIPLGIPFSHLTTLVELTHTGNVVSSANTNTTNSNTANSNTTNSNNGNAVNKGNSVNSGVDNCVDPHRRYRCSIKKTLLDLDGELFKTFEKVRDIWKFEDLYRSPGPIQLTTSSHLSNSDLSLYLNTYEHDRNNENGNSNSFASDNTNGLTNGFTNGYSNGFTSGYSNGFGNRFTNRSTNRFGSGYGERFGERFGSGYGSGFGERFGSGFGSGFGERDDVSSCSGATSNDYVDEEEINERRCFTLLIPTMKELVGDYPFNGDYVGLRRKDKSFMSELELRRLEVIPDIPIVCSDVKSRLVPFKQHVEFDQYIKNQIMLYYPYQHKLNHFNQYELVPNTIPTGMGRREIGSVSSESLKSGSLRVGVVPVGKQAPGVLNVFWGIFTRVSKMGGKCLAFHGIKGLLQNSYIELKESDFECFRNQGGLELVLRSKRSFLWKQDRLESAYKTCTALDLDGLVFLGDEMSMTQASFVTEYFMSRSSKTCVIGVPVAGGNSLGGDLIEACVGFDTNTRIYASLVGNVLTDAISMPKYWHFVKILGRFPSVDVLECALQTHPNVVIIAEEYRNSDKSLFDIVDEIANAIVKRSKLGKNFGTVLIPDHLVLHLPSTKNMLQEIGTALTKANQKNQRKHAIQQLMSYNVYSTNPVNTNNTPNVTSKSVSTTVNTANVTVKDVNVTARDETAKDETLKVNTADVSAKDVVVGPSTDTEEEYVKMITPWSLALFSSFPEYIRKEILNMDFSDLGLENLEIEVMLARMVKEELSIRKKKGEYNGNYAAVTHYFGYQGRCAIPSEFDCSLAYSYGHLAAICVESKLSGFCCSIRAVCGAVKDWKLFATPFTCMMKIAPDSFKLLINPKSEMPIIPPNNVSLNGKPFKKLKSARKKWLVEDLFNNPGPIQFNSFVGTQNIMLIIEHSQYYHMITSVERFTEIIKNICKFGVSEEYLHHAFIQLWGLIKITQDKNQLISLSQDFKLL
ncbi:Phosphofructokinase family protein [Theileria parva strain Muguga]|uniref:Phosphofructokinase family protein n=1 Tax=Theileria parva strain Muguga TaxID=333668 RepID=UPI001C624523|nr:Phosphofructokinase family protein [Theileria parva strain Muguga]EAN32860.2 Phosphofructokinase family protein [Theileria parva strain Muguga]